jgi:NAD-dependent SIR2 family protein deacetylase
MKAQGRKPVHRDYSKGFAPTAGHMGLVTLLEAGRLQHVISTNTDGIHRKSGLPADRLTEIHGNTNLEDCAIAPVGACEHPYAGNGCGRKYFRDSMCRRKGLQPHEHATGRTCTCGRPLQDTIINFNENLRQAECDAARAQAAAADLMICVGSSLRISNWAPRTVVKNPSARLVVVNLQWTPFEETADLVIHARSDEVFAGLQARLGLQPRQFQLTRYLRLRAVPAELSELKAAAAKAAAKAICGKVKVAARTNGKAAGGRAVALERLVAAGAMAVAMEVVCTDRDGVTPDAIIKAATLAGPAVPRGHVLSCAVRAAADPTKLQLISQASPGRYCH